jgi:hypothetical protein
MTARSRSPRRPVSRTATEFGVADDIGEPAEPNARCVGDALSRAGVVLEPLIDAAWCRVASAGPVR